MAADRTAKGTAAAKASGATLTIPNVSMIGGDILVVAVAWDTDEDGNPEVKHGGNKLDSVGGVTISTGNHRVKVFAEIINNTKTADLVATWESNVTARVMIATTLHQAGKMNVTFENENLNDDVSTTGSKEPITHIQTIHMNFHLTNGPAGDAIGSSSTGHTLGQRVGTTGDADTSNVTLQETYKIISAATIDAGSFVVDDTYQIKTIGTTDFTAIGAASNTVGIVFVATGIGSGTGDAYDMQGERSRLSGLTSRDHAGIMFFFQPKQTFTIKDIIQPGRNMNQNPYWVDVLVEDENGRGFWMRIDPDHYEEWSDAAISEYVAKFASNWVTNIIDSNLVYVEDTDLTDRFADIINSQVIL